MIKRLNTQWFKNNKYKKIIVCSLLTITVTISSFAFAFNSKKNNKNDIDYNSNNYITSSDYENYNSDDVSNTTKQIIKDTDNNFNYIVKFSENDNDKYKDNIKNIKVKYYYEEIINSEAALKKYYSIERKEEKHPLKYIDNKIITSSLLKNKIIQNNKEFLASHKNMIYSELSTTDFEKLFNCVVENLNVRLNDDIDIYQLDNNLDDLKLLGENRSSSGMYNEEKNIIGMNMKVITNNSNSNYFDLIAKHECNHLVQNCSYNKNDINKNFRNMGILYKWDDLKFNSLGYQWFEEGSAEKLMRIENPDYGEFTSYKYFVQEMDLLSLCTIYSEDRSEHNLATISLQNDLDKLFDMFDCKTEEEKIELINMMYTIEINYNEKNGDFLDAYNEKNGENFPLYSFSDYFDIKCSETMAKLFYYNLLGGLEGKEESLDNIFATINTFETFLNLKVKIGSGVMDYHNDFLNTYYIAQQSFFSALADNLGLNLDEINDLYNNYSMSTEEVINHSNILSNENKELINNTSKEYRAYRLSDEKSSISSYNESKISLFK